MANATSQPNPKPKPKYSNICRWIGIIFLVLIILIGLVILIVWLVIKPKDLIYSIEKASIHNYNLTNGHLKANFNFMIRTHNPNKKVSIYYDSIQATAFYEDQTVAFNSIDPFHQPRRNITNLGLDLAAKDVSLSESGVKDLRMERVRGKINLEIKIKARIRFKVGIWKSGHRTLRVSCGPVTIPFSSSKSFQTTLCDVDL